MPKSEEANLLVSPQARTAATRIATLGGPPVTIEIKRPTKNDSAKADSAKTKADSAKADSAKSDSAKSDDAAKKKHEQARKAARRRRIAARALLAQQTPKPPLDPFGQPTITARTR